MTKKTWKATGELMRLFQGVGRASLLYDVQDSHSGNMAMRHVDEAGNEWIVITATGSQKGDCGERDTLTKNRPSRICPEEEGHCTQSSRC